MTRASNDTPAITLPAVIVLIACVVLLGVAVIDVVYLLPVFTATIAARGGSYGFGGRVALFLARIGPVLLIAWVAGLIGLLVRSRRGNEERSQFRVAVALTALVLATYLALLTGAFVDTAVWVGGR